MIWICTEGCFWLENELKPLVIALHPKECFQNGLPEPVFLTYEDDTLYRVTINRSVGTVVGEFLVEDVQVESKADSNKDFRRRLRFKRMPNLIQSEIPLNPTTGDVVGDLGLDLLSLRKKNEVEFRVDTGVLVHTYLTAMVAGLFLIVSNLDRRIQTRVCSKSFVFRGWRWCFVKFLEHSTRV
ncbi:hypothetical protein L6452_11668 [Arctium lappa]|uniref:Uncharacterized protein n=1 Tax=Arctium lappa TaxID=4217 RepID=A0ACB9DPF3_ARCLA|nr:hypothetical protein L6452_11668 [Arctium lappa]